jgi:hypothetical protein
MLGENNDERFSQIEHPPSPARNYLPPWILGRFRVTVFPPVTPKLCVLARWLGMRVHVVVLSRRGRLHSAGLRLVLSKKLEARESIAFGSF